MPRGRPSGTGQKWALAASEFIKDGDLAGLKAVLRENGLNALILVGDTFEYGSVAPADERAQAQVDAASEQAP